MANIFLFWILDRQKVAISDCLSNGKLPAKKWQEDSKEMASKWQASQ